jgi:glucose/arabinose dehydrogenase
MSKKYLNFSVLIPLISILVLTLLVLPSCISAPVKDEPVAVQEEEEKDIEDIKDSPEEETVDIQELAFPEAAEIENRYTVQEAFPGISFNRPLDLQNAGDGSGRLFVVEQGGYIRVIYNDSAEGAGLFLDISGRVDSSGNEMGLLGLAFHPDFKNNGNFFVNYTDGNNTVISRFTVDPDNPDSTDPETEETVLTFSQPYANHNGGQIAFGPGDGYLYIGTGDGGSGGDPQGNAQNRKTLLGKILRIDVDNRDTGLNYAIPPDNPFSGNAEGYREEIYAYGLRNPWRFSFDTQSDSLWAADVGQNTVEEINLIEKGGNYGWNIMEGSLCFNPSEGCDSSGLELPVYEYRHTIDRSITGGYVYRGEELPELRGAYIYADFISGLIWGLWYKEGEEIRNYTLAETGLNISSFGTGSDNELYLTAFDGNIYRLVPLS